MPPSYALLGGFALVAQVACCYGNITRTQNVSKYMLVLALCLVQYCGRHCTSELVATLRGSRPGVQSASLIMTSLMTL